MTYAYWVGQWDGARFTAHDPAPQWLDWGWDWYAAVTWPNAQDPERVRCAIGWMNNWKYAARDVPTDATDGYNGQMSVVRRIRLVRRPDGRYSLLSEPVSELRNALGEPRTLERREVSGRWEAPIDPGARRVRLRIEVDTQSVEVFVDDGGVVVSRQVYFEADDAVVRLYAHGGSAVFSNAAFSPAWA